MKTRKLRLLSALLALAMMLALLPTTAFAEDGYEEYKGVIFSFTKIRGKSNTSITGYVPGNFPENGVVEIPAELGGLAVTGIQAIAFTSCTSLKTVIIPASVQSISVNDGQGAFANCTNLETVIFAPGSQLKEINGNAFNGCTALEEIICDESVKTLITGSVTGLNVKVEVYKTVTFNTDGGTAVEDQKVANGKTATEPTAPTKDGYIFDGWYTDAALNQKYDFSKAVTNDMTLYAKWTAGGDCGAEGDGSNLTWQLDSDGTLTISGTGKMADYRIIDVPWENQRERIKKIVIENGVTSIGKVAFAICSNATTVDIPESVTSINYGAFEESGLTSVTIPASVTELVWNAFINCEKLQKVEFAKGIQLEKIENQTFQGCSELKEITIPMSVTTIGASAFNSCYSLKKIIFEKGSKLSQIDNIYWVFYKCPDDLQIICDESVKQVLVNAGVSADKIKPTNPTVTFVSDGGTAVDSQTVANGKTVTEPTAPTRDGWNFVGWYTKDADGTWAAEQFDFNTAITDDMTLYARWATEWVPITPATPLYPITIDYGTAYDADHNAIAKAAAGDVVTIEANETAFDGMVFERWEDHEGNVKLEKDHAAKTSFTMPEGEVHLEAMYKAADNDDSSWDAATVVTGVAIGTGTAIFAYHIGTELYAEQVLGKGVAVPRTRAEVALLAWQLAGKPAVELNGEPLSEAAQAEKWAGESGLMQLDAEGNFNGAKKMSKLKALRTLEKAKQ